jgi:hypothetical protein
MRGRLTANGTVPRGFLHRLPDAEQRLNAINVILQVRLNPIASLLAAAPTECLCVEVTGADIPQMRVMGSDQLSN